MFFIFRKKKILHKKIREKLSFFIPAMNYSDFVLSSDVLKNAETSWFRSMNLITDPKQDGPKQSLRLGIEILNKLQVGAAFVKTTYDNTVTNTKNCGNTSVAQSVANLYFANLKASQKCDPNTELQVKIVNCGSGGDKVYIYGHVPSESITYVLDEVRSEKESQIASPHLLQIGGYKPKNPVSIEELQRRSKLLLEKSYPGIPVLVLITGPLRVHYFKVEEDEQKFIYSVMRDQLFTGKNVHAVGQYFITQEEEALYELKSTCNMYLNLSRRAWLEPIKIIGAIGIGGSSSQLSVFVPNVNHDLDSQQDEEIFTVCYPFGMTNPEELNKFPQYAYEKLQEIGFLQTLEEYKKCGVEIAFAMKSGTALLFDNFPKVLEVANLHKQVVEEVKKFKEMLLQVPEMKNTHRHEFKSELIFRLNVTRELASNLAQIANYPYHDSEETQYLQVLMKKTTSKIEKLEDLLKQSKAVKLAKSKSQSMWK
jgi:hypothetical protein